MKLLICIGFMLTLCGYSYGQSDSTVTGIFQFPNRLIEKINHKVAGLNQELDKQTKKYLIRLKKREDKLMKEMNKVDSVGAKNLFMSNPQAKYQAFLKSMGSDSTRVTQYSGNYLPYQDSIKMVMSFAKVNPEFLSGISSGKLDQTLNKFTSFQSGLSEADQIKQYVTNRKEQIRQYLIEQTKLSPAISSLYKKYSEDLYYYSDKIQSLKETLNDPDKLLKTALENLNKLPAFQDFVKRNSYLASLFPAQDPVNMINAINGLQTRDQLQQLVRGSLPTSGVGADALNTNVENAKALISQLQDRFLKYGQAGKEIDDPNFIPNTNRNKALFKRLEYGTSFQTQGSSYGVPAILNMGVSAGYRLKGSNIVGIGLSYLIGLGKPVDHIHISSQGIGFRSFIDIKLKGSFYLSGGYEYNQVPIVMIGQTNIIKQWQSSGLIGISKVIDLNSKVLKKTKVQLLWNFLSYYQKGPSQPIVYRVSYGL